MAHCRFRLSERQGDSCASKCGSLIKNGASDDVLKFMQEKEKKAEGSRGTRASDKPLMIKIRIQNHE